MALKHALILWDEVCIGLPSAEACWCMLITLGRCHYGQRTILQWTCLCWYSICSRFWPVLDAEAVRFGTSNFVILNFSRFWFYCMLLNKPVPQSLTFQVVYLASHRGACTSVSRLRPLCPSRTWFCNLRTTHPGPLSCIWTPLHRCLYPGGPFHLEVAVDRCPPLWEGELKFHVSPRILAHEMCRISKRSSLRNGVYTPQSSHPCQP